MTRIAGAVLCVAFIATLGGCGQSPVGLPPWLYDSIPYVTAEQLGAAPEEVSVAGHRLTIDAHLWRNFQPFVPPEGPPMHALVKLCDADSLALPADVDLAFLWLIDGDLVAAVPFIEAEKPDYPAHMEVRRAAYLPQWGPHIFVDVVVGIRSADGSLALLADREVWIERAD